MLRRADASDSGTWRSRSALVMNVVSLLTAAVSDSGSAGKQARLTVVNRRGRNGQLRRGLYLLRRPPYLRTAPSCTAWAGHGVQAHQASLWALCARRARLPSLGRRKARPAVSRSCPIACDDSAGTTCHAHAEHNADGFVAPGMTAQECDEEPFFYAASLTDGRPASAIASSPSSYERSCSLPPK